MKKSGSKKFASRGRGYTLTELLVVLLIFGAVSTAVVSLSNASIAGSKYVKASSNSTAQVELAMRRIIENLRSASWSGVDPQTGIFYIDTQPDPGNNGQVDHLSYRLQNTGGTAVSQLVETNSLYAPVNSQPPKLDLADNISSFTVTQLSSVKPTQFQITLTASPAGANPVTRTCTITCRNF